MGNDQDISALLSAMTDQAEMEKAEVLSEAVNKAREILARADEEIERLKAEASRGLEGEIRAESDRILGQVSVDERNARLSAKRRFLQEAFGRAREEIAALCSTDEYQAAMERLIREAVAAVGKDVSIEVRAKDLNFCSTLVKDWEGMGSVRAAGNEPGTVLVTAKDGQRRADNSLMTRLAKAEATMAHSVARVLFGEQEGEE